MNFYSSKHIILFFMILLALNSGAQHGYISEQFRHCRDSLVKTLDRFPKMDTARAKALFAIADCAAFLQEKKEVMQYWQEALYLSRRLKFQKVEAACLVWKGSYYKSAQTIDSAFIYLDSGIAVVNTSHDERLNHTRGFARFFKGQIYENQENLYPALESYFDALKDYDSAMPDIRRNITMRIASIYRILKNDDKAIEYYKITDDYNAVAGIYLEKNEIVLARKYLDLLKPSMPDTVETRITGEYYRLLGKIAIKENKIDSAIAYLNESLRYYSKHPYVRADFTTATLVDLAQLEMQTGNMAAAKDYTSQALAAARNDGRKESMAAALKCIAAYNDKTGNYREAYSQLLQSMAFNDSVVSASNIKQANTLGAIYENDKKEKEIAQLQADKKIQDAEVKRKSLLNTIFIIALAGILFTAFLLFRNYKHVQRLNTQEKLIHHQKVTRLENEKQLMAAEAMVKGQDEERTRLAKDLHDGLGGMLSGVKISFSNMKENMIMDQSSLQVFEKSISQLDRTIEELRKVSHNLMPEALVKYGLKSAIKDFCESVQTSVGTKIICEQLGPERELGSKGDVNVYRIVQELVNNAIKHANATQVLVQLTKAPNKILITVEDNGKGFDVDTLEKTSGIGFTNIRHRVNYLNGQIEINSKKADGTTVNIELMV